MKPTSSLVYDLDFMLNIWHMSRNLFHGGCCLAAALVAGELEQRGLEYKVVVFTDSNLGKYKDNINKIANDDLVLHVAIELETSDTGETLILGGDYENPGYVHGEYVRTCAKSLLYAYRHNQWNNHYNKKHNPDLIKAIRKVFAENEL